MRELVITARDRVGLLARVSKILVEHQMSIDSVSVETLAGQAVIHVATSDEKKAVKLLKDAGFRVEPSDVFVLKISDSPGELAKMAEILAWAGISIRSVHLIRRERGKSLFAVRVDKAEAAEKILKEYI